MAEGDSRISLLSAGGKVAQDTADKINLNLPVHITGRDAQKNPEFVKLLSTLSHRLTHTGVSKGLQKDVEQAKEQMRREKAAWLQAGALYHELEELLLDHDIRKQESEIPAAESQFYTAVQECLTTAEVCEYLECGPDRRKDVTLLGLTREQLQQNNPHRKNLKSLQKKLVPLVEERLKKKCTAVFSFHESSSNLSTDPGELQFAKASQLPLVLERERLDLQEKKRQLQQDRAARDRQFWQYYQILLQTLESLERIVKHHRLKSQLENNNVISEWLVQRFDAMELKIKVVEAQVLCDTYTAGTVAALRQIRRHLDSTPYDSEYMQSVQQLQAYRSVGMGFDSLVQEYGKLQEAIENKKWGLTELQKTC
ncbi:HAUS4 [Branchiostoma lanceolatum]|uniref:HAUS4 protein n=1 Tax=Branchiostoma lanceolatum TaxID=7740 RepID=A0A8K0A856_BRALA|nr:HAUS4 [Branchiostoma lanceolatum]